MVARYLFAGLVLIFTGIAIAEPAPSAKPAPYGLVSPEIASRLATLGGTPDADAVVKSARAKLSTKPSAMPRIHVEGTLPHQGIYDQSRAALEDWNTMIEFAVAWRLTKDKAFLQALDQYLGAWLDIYKASFNPIDETRFDFVIIAYDLAGSDLPPETQAKMKAFLPPFAHEYLTATGKNGTYVNNWQSHRVKLGTLAAFAVGDPALIDLAHQALLKQLDINLRADGSVSDFHERDALHYVTYDLEPLSMTVLAAKQHGLDWYVEKNAKGASIPAAIDWLVPYAKGEKKHVEFVHSKVGFDAARAKAGVPGFTGEWEPLNALGLYQVAALLDPKYAPIRDRLLKLPGAKPREWLAVLARAGL